MTESLRVQLLSPTAHPPTRGSQEAIGYDLQACLLDERGLPRGEVRIDEKGTLVLAPGQRALIPTGIAITVPRGTYGRIAPRSGLSLRSGIHTMAGVIDRDYTAEVGVLLINLSDWPFPITHGMRIAQLVLERAVIAEVETVDALDPTARGAGGFGSTGR